MTDMIEVKTCTCPSGDGSLRWPCPVHQAADGTDAINRDALKALAERVTTDRRFCSDEHHRYLAEGVLALFNEYESLRKDAKRYHWLRDKSESVHSFYLSVPVWLSNIRFRAKDVDGGIDAAIAGESKP